MARTAARVPHWEEWTPTYDGNSDDADPVTMELRGMPPDVKASWQKENSLKVLYQVQPADLADAAAAADSEKRDGSKGKAESAGHRAAVEMHTGDRDFDPLVPSRSQLRLVIRHCVKEVTNYNDANGAAIRSGEDLRRRGDDGFILEAYEEVISRTFLGEAGAKN